MSIDKNKKIEESMRDDQNDEPSSTMNYNIKIVDPSITLLANPEKNDSDAVIFKISKLGLTSSDITKIDASGIGMFLRKMSLDNSSKLRILDDFSFNFTSL